MQINQAVQGIYAITPDRALHKNEINKILKMGVCALQYRRKNIDAQTKYQEARILHVFCRDYKTLFIINDDVDLCRKLDADGVHLGSNDMNITVAREYLGEKKLIGVSCYNNLARAEFAEKYTADYVAFGALFPSKTKPKTTYCSLDLIRQAKKILSIPIVGIGGITWQNAKLAKSVGCNAVAMIDTLFS